MAGLLRAVERDMKGGAGQAPEDLAISALIMAPFVVTLVVIIGWMTWMPSLILVLLTVVLGIAAMLWNAGWRARMAA